MNYRWCGVPQCTNTSIKTPDKKFIHVPLKAEIRNKWLKLARRNADHLSPQSKMHFCEDHFDLEKDMSNYMEYSMTGSVKRIRLRDGCMPSKFECQKDRCKRTSTPSKPRSAVAKRQKLATSREYNRILEEYRNNEEKVHGCVEAEGNENDADEPKSNKKGEIESVSSLSDGRFSKKLESTSSGQGTPSPTFKTQPLSDLKSVFDPPPFPQVAESTSTQYVIKGKRFVNVGYLIKSLQKLNDHGGSDCNFSDMVICGETKEGWNIGVELSCRICFTVAVVWMEDPDANLVKTRPNLTQTATIPQTPTIPQMPAIPQTPSFLQPPLFTPKVCLKQRKTNRRKTPTPPPDPPVRHLLVPLPLARSALVPQSKEASASNQYLLTNPPLINRPQTTPFIKQEIILPHDGVRSSINRLPSSSAEPTAVQLLFYVDQTEQSQTPNTISSTETSTVETVTVTPDIYVGNQTSPTTCLGSSTAAENVTITPDIYPADILPVDLNLVKEEVVEEEPESSVDGHQSVDKLGVCLVPMSETSLDPSQTFFSSNDLKSSTEIQRDFSSVNDIKISSVTSCTKTSPTSQTETRSRTKIPAAVSETTASNIPTVSCTPTYIILKRVLQGETPCIKEVFKRTVNDESSSKLSKNNRKKIKN